MRKTLAALLVVLCTVALAAQKKDTGKPPAPEKPKDPAAAINKPRSDGRKVTFETTEATWASVDVTPDGRTLVFDLLGDIYTMPIDGGEARAISRGPAYDTIRASRPTARRSPSHRTKAAWRTYG